MPSHHPLPFDPIDSFQFISIYGYQAFIIAVRADNPIKMLPDLIGARCPR